MHFSAQSYYSCLHAESITTIDSTLTFIQKVRSVASGMRTMIPSSFIDASLFYRNPVVPKIIRKVL